MNDYKTELKAEISGEAELRVEDYIPVVGLAKYVIRNRIPICVGLEGLLIDPNLKMLNSEPRKIVKNTLERTGLLILYNSIVLGAVGGIVSKVFK